MTSKTTGEKFEAFRAAKKTYDEMVAKEGKAALADMFLEFFEKHPSVLGVAWTQYTPYFCDGDACTFGVNDACAVLSASSEKEAEELDEEDFDRSDLPKKLGKHLYTMSASTYRSRPVKPDWLEDLAAINKQTEEFQDIMLAAFGDHVSVVASRSGFKVNEYEHD